MKFQVREKERSIKDPTTNEELGSLQREKVRVKVVQVEARFSVARTYETYEVSSGYSMSARAQYLSAAEILGPFVGETKVKTLRQIDRPAGFGEIKEGESYVQVGDPVVLLDEVEKAAGREVAKAS
jgi:hypothetical protein